MSLEFLLRWLQDYVESSFFCRRTHLIPVSEQATIVVSYYGSIGAAPIMRRWRYSL